MSALPAAPAPSRFEIRSLAPSRSSVTHSLRRQVRSSGAQRWGLSLGWERLTVIEWRDLMGFFAAQRGQWGVFSVTPPSLIIAPRGTWGASITVFGASQTGRTITLAGFAVNAPLAVARGDFLRFANHAKVYVASADTAADANGRASIPIEPALLVSPADASAVTHAAVPFSVGLADDALAIRVVAPALGALAVELVEIAP